jgi:enamine deaminase RidA (YjgF/YER057c/UK114 family)
MQLLTHSQNLDAVLKGSGMTLKNVVKANIYLSNLPRDFNAVNEVSATCFGDPYFSYFALFVVSADHPPLRFGKR